MRRLSIRLWENGIVSSFRVFTIEGLLGMLTKSGKCPVSHCIQKKKKRKEREILRKNDVVTEELEAETKNVHFREV